MATVLVDRVRGPPVGLELEDEAGEGGGEGQGFPLLHGRRDSLRFADRGALVALAADAREPVGGPEAPASHHQGMRRGEPQGDSGRRRDGSGRSREPTTDGVQAPPRLGRAARINEGVARSVAPKTGCLPASSGRRIRAVPRRSRSASSDRGSAKPLAVRPGQRETRSSTGLATPSDSSAIAHLGGVGVCRGSLNLVRGLDGSPHAGANCSTASERVERLFSSYARPTSGGPGRAF